MRMFRPGSWSRLSRPVFGQGCFPLCSHKHGRSFLRPCVELLERRDLPTLLAPAVLLSDFNTPPAFTPTPAGLTPAQVRHAYGFDQISLPGGVAGDGSGTTIAIVDAFDDPTAASDLRVFDKQFGLPDPAFSKINQRGGSAPPQAIGIWGDQIALDVEWAHAMAPGAKLLLVEADDNSSDNLFAAVDYAARQPGVVAVSMSWGATLGEDLTETDYDWHFQTPSDQPGVACVTASGNTGAPPTYPASSPNVLAVGGTTLNLSSGNYGSEAGWRGSGGGISQYETQPTYQKGVVTPD